MPDKLLRVSKGIRAILSPLAAIGSWMLVAMVVVIMFDVTARKIPVLQRLITETWLVDWVSSMKLQEWEWHLHTIVFALCLGMTYLNDRHVRVGLWRDTRSPRTQAWVEIVGILGLLTPCFLVMIYYSVLFAATSYEIGESSNAVMGLSNRWMIKGVLALGFILVALSGIAVFLERVAFLAGDDPTNTPQDGAEAEAPSAGRHT